MRMESGARRALDGCMSGWVVRGRRVCGRPKEKAFWPHLGVAIRGAERMTISFTVQSEMNGFNVRGES